MHKSTKLSKIKCGDRASKLGFKQFEFDLVQLPAKLIKPIKKLLRNYAEVQRLCDALVEVVEASEISTWLQTPNTAFAGLKPIEVIERGEIDRLWEMVFRLRSGMPG